MAPLSPYEFENETEIIQNLSKSRAKISRWFDHRINTLEEFAQSGVAGNTFRAFRNLPKRPSVIYKNWALKELNKTDFANQVKRLNSQTAYDDWLAELSNRLRRTWKNEMGKNISYGASRKLPNLMTRRLVLWIGFTENQRNRLIGYLHVPLDSYTLVGIRNCVGLEIPKTATMKFVADEIMYNEIQAAIKKVSKKANVPSIYFDALCWDMKH